MVQCNKTESRVQWLVETFPSDVLRQKMRRRRARLTAMVKLGAPPAIERQAWIACLERERRLFFEDTVAHMVRLLRERAA